MKEMDEGTRKAITRRDALRMLAIGGAAGAVWKFGWLDRRRTAPVTRSRVLMGTIVNLTVVSDDREASAAAAEATLARMADLEGLLSRYRPDSEVTRLNTVGRVEKASDALLDVLTLAQRVSALGDGAFDVTVQPLLDLYRDRQEAGKGLPDSEAIDRVTALVDYRALRIDGRTVALARDGMRITLDGVGKGYIVDRGVDELKQRGFPNVMVEAGGDLLASGEKHGRPWRIQIRNPRAGLSRQARFDMRDRAVATSGDYMQPFVPDCSQHHILDPRTGRSSPELASATVIAPDAATADALATLTMVLGGRAGLELLEDMPDCAGYLVTKDLEVLRAANFEVL